MATSFSLADAVSRADGIVHQSGDEREAAGSPADAIMNLRFGDLFVFYRITCDFYKQLIDA